MQDISFLTPEEIEQILRLILELIVGAVTLPGPLITLIVAILRRIFPKLPGATLRLIAAVSLTAVVWVPVLLISLGDILGGVWAFLTFAGLFSFGILAVETSANAWNKSMSRVASATATND